MIRNDRELRATQERIRWFHEQVEKLRQVETNPENYRGSAGGFLDECSGGPERGSPDAGAGRSR